MDAEPASPLAGVTDLLGKTSDSIAVAKAERTEAGWNSANRAMAALSQGIGRLVAERGTREAAGKSFDVLSDKTRLADALRTHERRKKVEADGHLVVSPASWDDVQLLFDLRDVLLKHGRRDLVDKMRSLSPEELQAAVSNLLSGDPPREGSEIDKLLREFLLLGRGVRQQGTKDYDDVIDIYCSMMSGWRRSLDGKKVPALLEASLLGCRARLAQGRDKDALREYAAHADLLYSTLKSETATEALLKEADSLFATNQFPLAREVFLLTKGDPKVDEGAYASRLEAALCLIHIGQRPSAALSEIAEVYRDGYSTPRIARALYGLASAPPPERRELAVRMLKTALDQVEVEQKPRALFLLCAFNVDGGNEREAREWYGALQKQFPTDAYTVHAGEYLLKNVPAADGKGERGQP